MTEGQKKEENIHCFLIDFEIPAIQVFCNSNCSNILNNEERKPSDDILNKFVVSNFQSNSTRLKILTIMLIAA